MPLHKLPPIRRLLMRLPKTNPEEGVTTVLRRRHEVVSDVVGISLPGLERPLLFHNQNRGEWQDPESLTIGLTRVEEADEHSALKPFIKCIETLVPRSAARDMDNKSLTLS